MACGIYGCRNPQFGNSDWLTPPWIRKEWEAEEKIADSLFARKAQMNQAVAAVAGGTVESQQQVAPADDFARLPQDSRNTEHRR